MCVCVYTHMYVCVCILVSQPGILEFLCNMECLHSARHRIDTCFDELVLLKLGIKSLSGWCLQSKTDRQEALVF